MNQLDKKIPIVFKFLQKIPEGKVVSYKTIAKKCEIKNPRNVGFILRKNEEPKRIPCFKVVLLNGRLANGYKFGGERVQKKLLLKSGVIFDKEGKISHDSFIK